MVRLQRCLKMWESPDFDSEFISEMLESSHEVPLAIFCNYGGWPDDESLRMTVDKRYDADDYLYVICTVYFTESVPSSCKDFNHEEHAKGTLEISIEKETGIVRFPEERID